MSRFGILVLLIGCAPDGEPRRGGVHAGEQAPDFALKSIAGEEFRLSELCAAGDVVVVDFWSCICPCSGKNDSRLEEIARRFANRRVRFLLIDSNRSETPEMIARAVQERGITLPVLLDLDARVADSLGARTTPHVFVVDPSRIVRYVGPIDNDRAPGETGRAPFLEKALDAVLGGKKPPLTEVASYGCTIKQP